MPSPSREGPAFPNTPTRQQEKLGLSLKSAPQPFLPLSSPFTFSPSFVLQKTGLEPGSTGIFTPRGSSSSPVPPPATGWLLFPRS